MRRAKTRTSRTPMQTIRETLATERRIAAKVVEVDELLRKMTPKEREAALREIRERWPESWRAAPSRPLLGRRRLR
jgi:hypothetical protein